MDPNQEDDAKAKLQKMLNEGLDPEAKKGMSGYKQGLHHGHADQEANTDHNDAKSHDLDMEGEFNF